ncbi:MAG: DUF1638 domain-containing protein [Deltaproteobacteria bacterium]|nr:DUF1638 domain-containing protein [Deltaproteobacteria bacterium]
MAESAKPCVISCGILKTEIEKLMEEGSLNIEPYFLSDRLHYDYKLLEQGLGGAIRKRLRDCAGRIIVIYGDVCLGFNNEMKALIDKYNVIKVDALNCIDCLLGGKGKLLEIDPDHVYLFLNPSFIQFFEPWKGKSKEEARKSFNMLKGIILLDSLGNLDDFQAEIDEISDYTGLPILERRNVGLDGLKEILLEAIERLRNKPNI